MTMDIELCQLSFSFGNEKERTSVWKYDAIRTEPNRLSSQRTSSLRFTDEEYFGLCFVTEFTQAKKRTLPSVNGIFLLRSFVLARTKGMASYAQAGIRQPANSSSSFASHVAKALRSLFYGASS